MGRIFLGNFDFEDRLAAPGGAPSNEARRRNAELAFAWLAIAAPGDAVLTDCPPTDGTSGACQQLGLESIRFSSDVSSTDNAQLVPWGWNESVIRWASRRRLPVDHPPLPVVRQVNSREFSTELERAWNVGLEGQASCDSLKAVLQSLRQLDRWVLKANFGASGREQIRGTSQTLSDSQAQWIERRLRRDGKVFVEPFVSRISEVGVQWDIPRDTNAPPRLLGIAELLVDDRGQYSGSRIGAAVMPVEWEETVEVSRRAAREIQLRGYYGPLGIDAVKYSHGDGTMRTRPLQDINARWTMGRLALGLQRLLSAEETGLFQQGQRAVQSLESPSTLVFPFAQSMATTSRHQFSFHIQQSPFS